jgi:hypothetical protein
VDAGEIGRQEARKRAQEPATEGVPELWRPAPEKLSRPFRESLDVPYLVRLRMGLES